MKVVLKSVYLAYPKLFTPVEFQKSPEESDPAKSKYSTTLLIDPSSESGASNIKALKDAISSIAKEKWKNKIPKSLTTCLSNGDEKDNEMYAGYFVVSASDKFKPVVRSRANTDVNTDSHEASLLDTGAEVNAVITLWAQANKYGSRVNANIKGVQYISKGVELAVGGIDVASEFDELSVEAPVDFTEEI